MPLATSSSPRLPNQNVQTKLVAAAEQLIFEQGFLKIGVRDIARKAGVYPVEIYRLGLTKTDLLALVAIGLGERQLGRVQEFLHSSPPKGSLLQRVKAYLLFLYGLDIEALPIRSQSAGYGWFWGARYEDDIVSQVVQFLDPIERWIIEEDLSEPRERCMLVWSLYYVGFRAAVVNGKSAQECLDGIERPLAIALR